MTLENKLKKAIREVPDFPIKGVNFKDISTIFLQPKLMKECVEALADPWKSLGITKVIGIDSRGFLLGPQIALELSAGFVMVRKKGKLPPQTISVSYALEYGEASLESVVQSLGPEDKVIIHDDLLATGGTAKAAAQLASELGSKVLGFSFIVSLPSLKGQDKLLSYSSHIHSLISYQE